MSHYQCRIVYEAKHVFAANDDVDAKQSIEKLLKKYPRVKTLELTKVEPQPLINGEFQPAKQTRLI